MDCIEAHRHTSPAFENLSLGETPSRCMSSCYLNWEGESRNSTKSPIDERTDEWIEDWIERYENRSLLDAYSGSEYSTKQPTYPASQIQKQSINLKVSLQMFLHEATSFARDWKDANRKYDDGRSFPTFLWLLQMFGLDWHKYIVSEDDDINVTNQPNRWPSLQAPSYPNLSEDSNWFMANKYYVRSMSLMQLLQRIHSDSGNYFSREQAGLLASFLDHLIRIQQEQRDVAYGFSEHLQQLRKSAAAYAVTSSSNAAAAAAAADNGDRDRFVKHPIYGLCIMSRESAWLLMKLEASHSSSPSLVEGSHKILENIVLFISKFKKSKESLDQYLLDKCSPFNEDKMMQAVLQNKEVLNDFGKHMKDLQKKGVEPKSITEMLLGCFEDVVNKVEYYCNHANWRNPLGDTACSSVQGAFIKAAEETSEMICEAVEKLNSVRFSTLRGGGSPLGNITLWRILFESSLVNLQLDLICKKHGETIELGVKLLDTVTNVQIMDQLSVSIDQLLTVGESVLVEFVAMHRTMAEITYMLGDVFTTGGAGMDENDKRMEMDFDLDFPWDNHNVLDEIKIDLNDPRMRLLDYPCFDYYGPHSYTGFT
ncbi:hypothetical protein MKW94_002951 [Papaver nudicaule]|uniref:Uncharacterized protein n=1 Tax=Papaver nudicaule TaxID=74823 RepID=A0AA42AVB7_PAPNU|nr:hypothetical protein [Papaver nudicaule]